MLQNAQMALDFLRYKKIKLVNIRAEDIVDGNPKLTLGLIWTIILHFQVCAPHLVDVIFISHFPLESRVLSENFVVLSTVMLLVERGLLNSENAFIGVA